MKVVFEERAKKVRLRQEELRRRVDLLEYLGMDRTTAAKIRASIAEVDKDVEEARGWASRKEEGILGDLAASFAEATAPDVPHAGLSTTASALPPESFAFQMNDLGQKFLRVQGINKMGTEAQQKELAMLFLSSGMHTILSAMGDMSKGVTVDEQLTLTLVKMAEIFSMEMPAPIDKARLIRALNRKMDRIIAESSVEKP